MAAMLLTSTSPQLLADSHHFAVGRLAKDVKLGDVTLRLNYCSVTKFGPPRSLVYCRFSKADKKVLLKPISAVGSGLEATITDPKDNVVSIKNFEVVVESKDEDKMQVRVDLSGKETQIVFDKVLRNLAHSAPPVPGFRREKGGKTSKVPKDFLLQILGEDRVTNFVIQEIITSTLADYATKENLTVKDNKINTIQTAEELKSVFVPGNDFGFNATFELEKSTEKSSELTLELEKSTEESSELS